jgi:cytidine deaminase
MVLLAVEAEVDAHFGLFGDNANLTQDRCTVCAERTIISKFILAAPNGTTR